MRRCLIVVFICLILIHPAAPMNLKECHPDVLIGRPPRLSEFAKKTLVLPNTALIETEKGMREQGYSEVYIAGLDVVKRNLRLAKALRHVIIHPWTDHIPAFVPMIDEHIHFIEEGIRLYQSSDREHRLNQLQVFKAEAEMVKDLERVTYRWYLNFNYRLSILATPQEHRRWFIKDEDWITNEALEAFFNNTPRDKLKGSLHLGHLLDLFPDLIVLPTSSDLGVISLNRTVQTGISLLGLVNQPVFVEGRLVYPQTFWEHDVDHTKYMNQDLDLYHLYHGDKDFQDTDGIGPFQEENAANANFTIFHNELIYHRMGGFPRPLRKRVEFIYFQVTHEKPYLMDYIVRFRLDDDDAVEEILSHINIDSVSQFAPDNLRDQNGVLSFVQRGIADFLDIALQINTP